MKGVDESGVEVASRRPEGYEAGGVLAGLDVITLRVFLIRVMREGGVPTERMAEVMRVSRPTLFRDARPSKNE